MRHLPLTLFPSPDVIEKIPPGKKLAMQWLALWKSNNFYRNDQTVWSNLYKDFVVTDSPELDYYYTFMADGRTIGKNTGDNCGCICHPNKVVCFTISSLTSITST